MSTIRKPKNFEMMDNKLDALIDSIIDIEEEYTGGLPDVFKAALQRAREEKTLLLTEEYPTEL